MSSRTRTLLAWLLAIAVLAGVFAMYTQPALMVTLSERLWACFN